MAGSSTVLREYLVSLGYSVDAHTQRRFDTSLLRTDLGAKNLLRTLLGVAAAAQGAMVMYARSMERMLYTSIKAESSISKLQQMDFAFRNIGLTSEDMQSAIQGIARSLRANPGLVGLLESLGVRTTGRDRADVLVDLVQKLKSMPFYIASQYAQMFGIDPDQYLLLSKGVERLKEAAEYRRIMAQEVGYDADRAAASAKEYSDILRELTERFSLLGQAMGEKALPHFKAFSATVNQGMKDLTAWLNYKGGDLQEQMNSDLGGRSPLRAYWDYTKSFWGKLFRPGSLSAYTLGKGLPPKSDVMGGRGNINPPNVKPGPEGGGFLPLGLRNNNPGNLRSWGSASIRNGFAAFGSAEEGLSAMIGNLQAYQRRGLNTVEGIIGRWAPPNENNTAAYIKAVAQALGVDASSKLNLNDPAVMQALAGAIVKHEQGYNPYTSADYANAMQSRGIVIQQKTDIHVNGTDSPESTARAVGREQSRVNADAVRNLGGNIR